MATSTSEAHALKYTDIRYETQSSVEWLTGISDGLFHNYPLKPLTQNVIKRLKNNSYTNFYK